MKEGIEDLGITLIGLSDFSKQEENLHTLAHECIYDPSHKLAVVFSELCDTDGTYPSIKSPKITHLLSGQQDTR